MYSFDEWVEAVFRHPPPDFGTIWDAAQCHPEWLMRHAAGLFAAPGFLRARYTADELERGFKAIVYDWELSDAVWEARVPWPQREACIRAMPGLFREVFTHDPLGYICFMWFDLFRDFADDPDPRVGTALAEAAAEVLLLPSVECQYAALHGLGHFDHPRRREWIDRFLRAHRNIDPEFRAFALAAVEGNVL